MWATWCGHPFYSCKQQLTLTMHVPGCRPFCILHVTSVLNVMLCTSDWHTGLELSKVFLECTLNLTGAVADSLCLGCLCLLHYGFAGAFMKWPVHFLTLRTAIDTDSAPSAVTCPMSCTTDGARIKISHTSLWYLKIQLFALLTLPFGLESTSLSCTHWYPMTGNVWLIFIWNHSKVVHQCCSPLTTSYTLERLHAKISAIYLLPRSLLIIWRVLCQQCMHLLT